MKDYGLSVNTPSEKQLQEWFDLISRMDESFRGSFISEDAYDRLMDIKKNMSER